MSIVLYIAFHAAWILSILVGVIFFAHALQTRRSPASTAAWLLLVLLVPVLGIVIYLVFGVRKSPHGMARRESTLALTRREEVPEAEADLVDRLIRRFDLPGATDGNSLRILPTGEECWQGLVDLIESAEKFIHIQTFVLHFDEVGSDIVERLCRKAKAGVEVRLLVDAVGTLPTRYHHFKKLVEAGGHVVMFDPILRAHGHTNLRNHRKIAVADARRVFAGGTNIASEYLGPTPLEDRWKDLSFVLEGPSVTNYCEIFCSDWAYAARENLGEAYVLPAEGIVSRGADRIQVVPSGPDLQHDVLYDAIIQAIFDARERVRCVTPYFIPDDTLMRALELAARRGVQVDIITPRKSNHGVANVARGPYLRDLEEAGANILLYEPGMVHAKITLVDQTLAMIGSTNLDQRSLFLNYEVSALIWRGDAIMQTARWVETLVEKSTRGTPPAGRIRGVMEGLVQVAAPLL